ncbi:transglutaminase-like domain-containing protein [Methylobacter sp. YRD-M1]|uniref:transglutaminase-like domain-containing protein n=1 Tax=Methylobacter sp. YRD-M1 TaxID=2911520 RepID=UPI00227A5F08|nr:transglutaminase family protein [Methylobacter sp. YRD-M1]WAK04037.1 transglutaminase family protein [Methylobacter sp. YRD-M1]
MEKYLQTTEYIDWKHPAIVNLAVQLADNTDSDHDAAKKCFEWVRDNVRHSWDYRLNTVTCKASEVLQHKTGYCYAKSHLLAALLRANNIPAGLCYQRLSLEGNGAPYCLHGLNAVYLQDYGWYRIDARGNKDGVNAEFHPPQEQLAFAITEERERDFPEIWPEPLPSAIKALTENHSYLDVYHNLPDVEIIPTL